MTQSVDNPNGAAFAPNERFSLLVHALSKRGKSTLTATAPKPILVLDAEGGWRFIPLRMVPWDPMAGPPPVYDGSWDACQVIVHSWETIPCVYQWLTQYKLPFVSVVIDSITEIQRRLKQKMFGTEAMRQQDWGVLLTLMDKAFRDFRDLTLLPGLDVRCVAFVAETRQGNDSRWTPYMQGQIANSLPYWVDVCTYMFADMELDANGQPLREVRRAWMSPHPQFECGERVQGRLGQFQNIYRSNADEVGTDITDWMHTIFRHPQSVIHTPIQSN